jgi:CelD/BcsL family acetyltransferase involved in cellulose biosynthesis
MLRWRRIDALPDWDSLLQSFPDRTVFQSSSWLQFLRESTRGELVLAALRNGQADCGYFAGMVITRFGLRILGSPLPGWTTSYMGFALKPEVLHADALSALKRFAFEDLGCVHLEVMDRGIRSQDLDSCYQVREYKGYEIDLSRDEDRLFSNMIPACRRCIRKASRCGVVIEEANDAGFAADYYQQLKHVFARQGLSPTYSADRVRALIRHLGPTGNLLLLRARDSEGRCIATGIFPAMNARAYFWGGASWREHQHLRPNESLMWHAIRYWKSHGIRYFDFGGGGDYKRKYGAYDICIPWLRTSRYPLLPTLRDSLMVMTRLQQRWRGALVANRSPLSRDATSERCV